MESLNSLVHEAPANVIITLFIVPLIQWARQTDWPVLRAVNDKTVWAVSGLMAAGAALGIHLSFDPVAGVATISGLTLQGLVGGAFEWSKQWVIQHWGWKVMKTLDALPDALAVIAAARQDPPPTPPARLPPSTTAPPPPTP